MKILMFEIGHCWYKQIITDPTWAYIGDW